MRDLSPPAGRVVLGVLARNAGANIVRGVSAAAFTILMPLLLTRRLGLTEYSVWVLLFQLAGYLTWLELGLQNAVARHVAAAVARDDRDEESAVMSSALGLFLVLAVIAAGTGALFAWGLPHWWEVPRSIAGPARLGLLALTGSVVFSQLSAPFAGELIGRQRLEISAAITLAANVTALIGVGLVATAGGSLAAVAAILAAARTGGYLLHVVAGHRVAGRLPLGPRYVRRNVVRHLTAMAGTYLVFNLGLLLVTGLDTAIVGWIDFEQVGAYGIAAGGVTFLNGLAVAASSPLLPHAAGLEARRQADETRALILRASRVGGGVLLGLSAVIFILSDDLVRVWVGESYVPDAVLFMRVLVVGNLIRLLSLPLVMVAMGAGDHRPLRVPAIIEGVVNVTVSVGLGLALGPVGVALGTVAGSLASVAIIALYAVPRSASLAVSASEVVHHVLVRPLVVVAALVASWALLWWVGAAGLLLVKGALLLATGAVVWLDVLRSDDRRWIGQLISRAASR